MPLRSYQQEAVDALFNYLQHLGTGNPLIVAPTGSGKSHLIAETCRRFHSNWPAHGILVVSDTKEILEQNAEKIHDYIPNAPLALYGAGFGSRRVGPITVAQIQTAYRKPEAFANAWLVIVDECHAIPPRGMGMYRRFLTGIKEHNPAMRLAGFTATPFRCGTGLLHEGEGALFDAIAYEIGIRELIDAGHLAPLVSKSAVAQADMTNVRVARGDYVTKDAAFALDRDELTEAALDEIEKYAGERTSWLLFCVNVEHTKHVAEALRRRGKPVATVTGETDAATRASIVERFKRGGLALCNCAVFTTGFDAPNVDMIALLRPTKSLGLYIQMLGRGMRNAPGKKNCLVMDFAGNIERHGPIDSIQVASRAAKKRRREGPPPMKACPECRTVTYPSARECAQCGYQFIEDELPHGATASDANVMGGDTAPVKITETFTKYPVWGVSYRAHRPAGKKPSLRVDYLSGSTTLSEWVFFEHAGYPRVKAERWWYQRTGNIYAPRTVSEALAQSSQIRKPSEVYARKDGQYWKVTGARFGEGADVELTAAG